MSCFGGASMWLQIFVFICIQVMATFCVSSDNDDREKRIIKYKIHHLLFHDFLLKDNNPSLECSRRGYHRRLQSPELIIGELRSLNQGDLPLSGEVVRKMALHLFCNFHSDEEVARSIFDDFSKKKNIYPLSVGRVVKELDDLFQPYDAWDGTM